MQSSARRRDPAAGTARIVLPVDQSGLHRDRLLAELEGLHSSDEAASWARQSLPTKNTLTVADAELVENAFQIKLAAFGEPPEASQNCDETSIASPNQDSTRSSEAIPKEHTKRRGGRVPAKTIRLRDNDHRKFVSNQPCLVCGRTPADAHHLRFAQPRALGRKVSDEFTVPVCRVHHRELHRRGDERIWWREIKIDPLPIAQRLWQHARLNKPAIVANGNTQLPSPSVTNGTGTGAGTTDPDFISNANGRDRI